MSSNDLLVSCLIFVTSDGKHSIIKNFVLNNVDMVDMRNQPLVIEKITTNKIYCYSSKNATHFDSGSDSDLDIVLKELAKSDYDTLHRIMEIIYDTQIGRKLLSYIDEDKRSGIELLIKLRR